MRYRSFILQDVHFCNQRLIRWRHDQHPDRPHPYQTKSGASEHLLALGCTGQAVSPKNLAASGTRSWKRQDSLLSGYLCVQSGLLQGDGFLGLATSIKSEPLQERRENEDQTHSTYWLVAKTTNKRYHKAVAKSKNRVRLESSLFNGRSWGMS